MISVNYGFEVGGYDKCMSAVTCILTSDGSVLFLKKLNVLHQMNKNMCMIPIEHGVDV